MRPIDADALVASEEDVIYVGPDAKRIKALVLWVVTRMIDKAPTISETEQPKKRGRPTMVGHWKPCFEDWRKQIGGDECSLCGFQYYGSNIEKFRFCPSCGHPMEVDNGQI